VKKVRSDTLQGVDTDTRVKSIKVTVMSKKDRQFFEKKIGLTPQNWQTAMSKKGRQFFFRKT